MKSFLIAVVMCVSPSLFAVGEPLNIGTESFSPPFVMQGSNHAIYGFDIDMMNSLCKIMQRTCQFHVMQFNQLLNAVANGELDAAVSSITITPERAKTVNFSLPYSLSYSRFLGRQSSFNGTFSLDSLNNKVVGLESGTIFEQEISSMGEKSASIKEYPSVDSQLTALSQGAVDIILLDNATAIYWASNSSETFKLLGPAYLYGYGLGIALNPQNPDLLSSINKALLQYQNSDDYKANYDRYLYEF